MLQHEALRLHVTLNPTYIYISLYLYIYIYMHTILYGTYIIGTRSLKVLFLVDGGVFHDRARLC